MVTATAREAAAATPDPELPQLTIDDLGILRSVEREGDTVIATITPTYSGCPAIREIGVDLRRRLAAAGFARVEVRTRLAPPWSSDYGAPVCASRPVWRTWICARRADWTGRASRRWRADNGSANTATF